jgi:hypothetical protein
MANSEKIPKGKIQLYCYVKIENKDLLKKKAEEFDMSESRVLDLVLDVLRRKPSNFTLHELVKR